MTGKRALSTMYISDLTWYINLWATPCLSYKNRNTCIHYPYLLIFGLFRSWVLNKSKFYCWKMNSIVKNIGLKEKHTHVHTIFDATRDRSLRAKLSWKITSANLFVTRWRRVSKLSDDRRPRWGICRPMWSKDLAEACRGINKLLSPPQNRCDVNHCIIHVHRKRDFLRFAPVCVSIAEDHTWRVSLHEKCIKSGLLKHHALHMNSSIDWALEMYSLEWTEWKLTRDKELSMENFFVLF